MAQSNAFFESINSILKKSDYWLNDGNIKQYFPMGVNTGLSQHLDTIFHVNEMNMNWKSLTPKMHYDYLYNSIHKMKRKYEKWAKKDKTGLIPMIMEYYQVNRVKAEDYLRVLSEENIEAIKRTMEKRK